MSAHVVQALRKMGIAVEKIGTGLEVNDSGGSGSDRLCELLAECADLVSLDISETDVTDDGIRLLRDLPRLRELSFSRTNVTGTAFEFLPTLPRLAKLVCTPVSECGMAFDFIGDCRNLVELDLDFTSAASNASLDPFARLSKLERLSLVLCPVSSGFEALVDLRSLRDLDLERSAVTDDALDSLSRIRSLESLYLGSTRITDAGVAALPAAESLRTLGVSRTALTGAGIASILEIASLRELYLSRVPIDSGSLSKLSTAGHLKTLHVTGCGLRFDELSQLRSALRKCKVICWQSDERQSQERQPASIGNSDRPASAGQRWNQVTSLRGWTVAETPDDFNAIQSQAISGHHADNPLYQACVAGRLDPPRSAGLEELMEDYDRLNLYLHDKMRRAAREFFKDTSFPGDRYAEDDVFDAELMLLSSSYFSCQNEDWYRPSYECRIGVLKEYLSTRFLRVMQEQLRDEHINWCIVVQGSEDLHFDSENDVFIYSDRIVILRSVAASLGIPLT